jgi:DNA-binding CsgD family transcriptional regulator
MGLRVNKGSAEDGGFILKNNIHITKRELEALTLIGMGLDNREVAKRLGVSVNTVRNHIYNIMLKLGANSRAHAIALAVQNVIITIETDKSLVGWEEDDYRLCIMCGRVSLANEFRDVEPVKTTINHVEYEVPQSPQCPYEGCKGDWGLSIPWSRIRANHPEYPKIPKQGKAYIFELDWLLES